MEDLSTNFEQFRSNVFRRENESQFRAKLLWTKLSPYIPKEDSKIFVTEWTHYKNNQITINEFGEYFNKHIKRFFMFNINDLRNAYNKGCKYGSVSGMRVARGGEMNLKDFDEWFKNSNK